jgi:hypothetical protein
VRSCYILDKDGKEIMIGQKRNHLYYVLEILDKKGETAAASTVTKKWPVTAPGSQGVFGA